MQKNFFTTNFCSFLIFIYADIRDYLKKSGSPIGNMDMLIAAAAIATKAPLVTNNKKHFGLIPNLIIADWP